MTDLEGPQGGRKHVPNVAATPRPVDQTPEFTSLDKNVALDATELRALWMITRMATMSDPTFTSAVRSVIPNGQREPLHYNPQHHFMICETDVFGVRRDASGHITERIDAKAGDIILRDPVPEASAESIDLLTNGELASVVYVSYTVPKRNEHWKDGTTIGSVPELRAEPTA